MIYSVVVQVDNLPGNFTTGTGGLLGQLPEICRPVACRHIGDNMLEYKLLIRSHSHTHVYSQVVVVVGDEHGASERVQVRDHRKWADGQN